MSSSKRYLRWAHDGGIAGVICAAVMVIWGIVGLGMSPRVCSCSPYWR